MTITKAKHFPSVFHPKSTKPFGFQRFSAGLGFTCARALPQTCKPSQRPDILPEATSLSKHEYVLYFDAFWRTDHAQSVSEALKCVFRLLRKFKNPRKSSVFVICSMTFTKKHTFVFSSVWSEITTTTTTKRTNNEGFPRVYDLYAPQTCKLSQSSDIPPKAKICSKHQNLLLC